MKVLAKTRQGSEFVYRSASAHKVSEKSGRRIMETLNSVRYDLKDGETWFMYDVCPYDNAYVYAEYQSFSVRNGRICESTF